MSIPVKFARMKEIIAFLHQLNENNNRPWFQAHNDQYEAVNDHFHGFVDALIAGIASFEPEVAGLTAKDCSYRIYRDVRFSHNKMPFKTHFAAYICPHGKKSPYAGYYFHVEPKGFGYLEEGHQLCSGLYGPEPHVLKSVREDILHNGDAFHATVQAASGFSLEPYQALKRVPQGCPSDHPYADYLKMRHPCLIRVVDEAFMLSPNLLTNTLEAFHKTAPFVRHLNQAVAYALE